MQNSPSNQVLHSGGMLLSPQGNTQGLSLFDLADGQDSSFHIPGLAEGVDLDALSKKPKRLREKMMEMIEAVDDCESCAWYTYRLGLKPTPARLRSEATAQNFDPQRIQYLSGRAWQISKMKTPPVRTLGCDCCDTRLGLRLATARPAVARCISEVSRSDDPMRSRLVSIRDKALYVADLYLFGHRSLPNYERALASDAKKLVLSCRERFLFLDAAHQVLDRIQPDESRREALAPVLPYLTAAYDGPAFRLSAGASKMAHLDQTLRFLSDRSEVMVSVREQLAQVISHRGLPTELGERFVLDRVALFVYSFLNLCPVSDEYTLAAQARNSLIDYVDRVELLDHMYRELPKQAQRKQWPDELLSRVTLALPAMVDQAFFILGRKEKSEMNAAKREGRRYEPGFKRTTQKSLRRRLWSKVINPYVAAFPYKEKQES